MTSSAEETIRRWKFAYTAANNDEPPPIDYRAGWYTIEDPHPVNYRASEIRQMTINLMLRSAQ